MTSFEFEIDEQSRVATDFISAVRGEIQRAIATERAEHGVTQQSIAKKIGTNRSVINRQVTGLENMGLRRVAELLWAIGWEPFFEARRPEAQAGANEFTLTAPAKQTSTAKSAYETLSAPTASNWSVATATGAR